MRTFRVGDTVWHGFRYWKSDSLKSDEVIGWNTLYVPYQVRRITAKQLVTEQVGQSRVILNRATMERDGKQYHTRFHEYFYAEKPKHHSKDWNWAGSDPGFVVPSFTGDCLAVLELSPPYTTKDVKRAYRRLALKTHPDLGGNSADFIKLKRAYDSALRFTK